MSNDRENFKRTETVETSAEYSEKVRAEDQHYRELNIRATPDRDAKIIAVIKMGTVVYRDPSYMHPHFSKIQLQNGQEGYAVTSFLKKA